MRYHQRPPTAASSLVQRVPARQRDWIHQHLEAHGAATVVMDLRLAGSLVPGAAGGRRVAIVVRSTRSWLRRWYAPWYARGSPLTLPGKLVEGCGTAHWRRGWVYESVQSRWCERATAQLYNTVYCTMQALFLAQVCTLRTHIPLCGTRLHEGQHRLLVVFGSCGCQGCAAGVARSVEVSTSLQERPCNLHWPNVTARATGSPTQFSRPDAAEGGTRVRPT
jgi:hypothetical protein